MNKLEWTVQVPGKILLIGGYSILNPEGKGLCFSVSAHYKVQLVFEDSQDLSLLNVDLGNERINI